jgi:hypothetical protein
MSYKWKINKKKLMYLIISLVVVIVGAQVSGAAESVDHAIAGGVLFFLGYLMTFGLFDTVSVEVMADEGEVIVADLSKIKDDDEIIAVGLKYLDTIAKVNAGIPCPELTDMLNELISKGNEIIELLQQDPESIHKAQKFLVIYLADAASISAKYAKLHQIGRKTTLDKHYRELLIFLLEAFNNQYDALRRNEIMELDAEIEVLSRRVKQESF